MMNLLRLVRHLVVGLAATAAILVPAWFVITAFGGKFGIWTPLEAFGHVRSLAGVLLPAALILGVAALCGSSSSRCPARLLLLPLQCAAPPRGSMSAPAPAVAAATV